MVSLPTWLLLFCAKAFCILSSNRNGVAGLNHVALILQASPHRPRPPVFHPIFLCFVQSNITKDFALKVSHSHIVVLFSSRFTSLLVNCVVLSLAHCWFIPALILFPCQRILSIRLPVWKYHCCYAHREWLLRLKAQGLWAWWADAASGCKV